MHRLYLRRAQQVAEIPHTFINARTPEQYVIKLDVGLCAHASQVWYAGAAAIDIGMALGTLAQKQIRPLLKLLGVGTTA